MHPQPSQKDMKILEELYNSEKFSKLEIETKALLKKYPKVPVLLNILGFSLHKQGHLNAAVTNYKEAIIIDPKFVFAQLVY